MHWQRFKPIPEKLVLHGYWRSSASWRVRWGLALKKVVYDYVPVNILQEEHRSPQYLKRNPSGMVPTLELVNEGVFLGESLAILEWAEEVYSLQGVSLFPGTPLERARARQLAEIINSGTAPLQTPRTQKYHSDDPAERLAWAQHFIRSGLKAYDEISAQTRRNFSVGDVVSVADICLIPQLYNARRWGVEAEKEFPALWAILERALATPECLASSPEKQPDAVV